MQITEAITYVGVNDEEIDLFEGLYRVPNGVSYNSYVILDEKIAVMDTVDAAASKEWFAKLQKALAGRAPDYLVVQHMEPDHSANIKKLAEKYPQITIVASEKAFVMMQHFFGTDFSERRLIISDGDTLALGRHTLTFLSAVMVHWPEVMMSYVEEEKLLFSADAFGSFGAVKGEKEETIEAVWETWADEAARYYFGIVGRYGLSVQKLLRKLSGKEIRMICPLHGRIVGNSAEKYIHLYDIWSSYRPEKDGVLIVYTSVYGNTKKAVYLLAEKLKEQKAGSVEIRDISRCEPYAVIADAFRCSCLVLATTTYCTDIFPDMREFVENLVARNFSNHFVAFVENGSWMPVAAKLLRERMQQCKGITFAENTVKLMSSLSEENRTEMDALVREICSWKEFQEV